MLWGSLGGISPVFDKACLWYEARSEKREARKSCRRRLCEGHADMRGSADLLSDDGVVVRRLDLETAVVGPEVD